MGANTQVATTVAPVLTNWMKERENKLFNSFSISIFLFHLWSIHLPILLTISFFSSFLFFSFSYYFPFFLLINTSPFSSRHPQIGHPCSGIPGMKKRVSLNKPILRFYCFLRWKKGKCGLWAGAFIREGISGWVGWEWEVSKKVNKDWLFHTRTKCVPGYLRTHSAASHTTNAQVYKSLSPTMNTNRQSPITICFPFSYSWTKA